MSDVVKYVPVPGGDGHIKQLAVDPRALEEWISNTEEALKELQQIKQMVYDKLGLSPSMFEDANDNSEIT